MAERSGNVGSRAQVRQGETRWDTGTQRFMTAVDVRPGAVTKRQATHEEIRRLVDVDDMRVDHRTHGPLVVSTTLRRGRVARQVVYLRQRWWAFWRWDS